MDLPSYVGGGVMEAADITDKQIHTRMRGTEKGEYLVSVRCLCKWQ